MGSADLAALNRRRFLGGTLAAAAASLGPWGSLAADAPQPPPEFKRKIKLGVVGNGGRGAWIAGLFKRHGGYEMHAVADYFPEVADAVRRCPGRGQGAALLHPVRLQAPA